MVNFSINLTSHRVGKLNVTSECIWMRLAFDLEDSEEITLPSVGGHRPIRWGLNRAKVHRRRGLLLSPCFTARAARASSLLFCPWTRFTPSAPLVLRLGDSELHPRFSGSPVCREQVWGLLSHHNYMGHFLIVNLFLSLCLPLFLLSL